MSDLVSGKYGQQNPMAAVLPRNVANPIVPGRSNLEYLGFSNMTDGALAATGIAACVAVPVDPGTVITNVSVPIGATAASTPTHSFVALYSGIATPALIGQSTDITTTAVAASASFTWALTTPQLITPAMAPNGFIYAAVVFAVTTTVPTAAVVATPTAVGYQWFTTSTTPAYAAPIVFSGTSGSSLTATAAATLSLTAKAVAPVVILT